MLQSWPIQAGAVVTRAQVREVAGGGKQRGIEPSTTNPSVLVYSDPKQGARHGYNFDGSADGAFYYTGEGQVGDQRMTNGNRAIREHAIDGRTLRVFEAVQEPVQAGGKRHRYLGSFYVDPHEPFRREDAPDRTGEMRSLIVFKLLPDSGEVPSATPSGLPAPSDQPIAELVDTELNVVGEYAVVGRDGGAASRREAALMQALEDQLRAQGHTVGRFRLRPPGSATSLVTDTYDVTRGRLFEVKATSDRNAVRMALGQLLDYRRHLPEVGDCAVVLPERPAEDLVELIFSVGFGLGYRSAHCIAFEPAPTREP